MRIVAVKRLRDRPSKTANCLGRESMERVHSLEPTPPARTAGNIISIHLKRKVLSLSNQES